MSVMFVVRSGQNEEILKKTLHRCLLPSLVPFGRVVSEEKIKCGKLTDEGRFMVAIAHMTLRVKGANKYIYVLIYYDK